MATYKVIQDIEAEDKLFGPFTLKQFIFACITVICLYVSFWSFVNGAEFLIIIFLPVALFFGTLAFPWSKDQSTEVWLMAKLRFYFRPKKRIWDQAGIKDLVTITAPKTEEKIYTDGLSNTEVKSRLRALADTIDSRGWAVKSAAINLGQQDNFMQPSDRLVGANQMTQQVASYDIKATDDIYDELANPTAQHFDQMIQKSEQTHRQQLVSQLNQPNSQQPPAQNSHSQQNDYWFMRQPEAPKDGVHATFGAAPLVAPGQTQPQQQTSNDDLSREEEQKILNEIYENKSRPDPMNSHLKTIRPLSDQPEEKVNTSTRETNNDDQGKTTGNQTAQADILNLAHNDDLNIETLARQANKARESSSDDEVVVSLH